MKNRSTSAPNGAVRSFRAAALRSFAGAALVAGACSSTPSSPAESCVAAPSAARTLVLASPTDAADAERIDAWLDAPVLAARLDGTMGAPGATLVVDDTTTIQVFDRQYTWNGRMHDSYSSTRWSTRVQQRR